MKFSQNINVYYILKSRILVFQFRSKQLLKFENLLLSLIICFTWTLLTLWIFLRVQLSMLLVLECITLRSQHQLCNPGGIWYAAISSCNVNNCKQWHFTSTLENFYNGTYSRTTLTFLSSLALLYPTPSPGPSIKPQDLLSRFYSTPVSISI